jgi:hypothetical protein
MKAARVARWIGTIVIVGFVVLQFVSNGVSRRNPGITVEPNLDPEAREVAARACFDCHSYRTSWPWYAELAPMRWLVSRDVADARSALNFSEFHDPSRLAEKAAGAVRAGTMPPARYVALHPRAHLSPVERETLVHGLEAIRDGRDQPSSGGAAGAGFAE